MFYWPKLELTDYERLWVRPYKTKEHAGVLRRTYERTLYGNEPSLGGPDSQVQIARRARVFALSFSGSCSQTRLQITNASGTLYNVRDARTGLFPIVNSMLGGSFAMQGAWVGPRVSPPALQSQAGDDIENIVTTNENGVLLLDPNWVLTPNETLIFSGTWDNDVFQTNTFPRLNIAVHVWEFPGMGNADKAVREVV